MEWSVCGCGGGWGGRCGDGCGACGGGTIMPADVLQLLLQITEQ